MEKCFCYEKFKDRLPKDFRPTCFKEKCRNYRENMKRLQEKSQKDKD
ncbi:hypothetical protein TMU01_09110 [Tenuibacillus multivorans]|nr:hypothetical protein TMU01_09110 [Tenuibacillus multivorans]